MKCRKCGYDNDPKSLFCEQCGSKLAKKSKPENSEKERKCPQCKHKNKGEYAFCEICGAPLRAKAPKKSKKKILIVIFSFVLLAGASCGIYYFLNRKPAESNPKSEVNENLEYILQDEDKYYKVMQDGKVYDDLYDGEVVGEVKKNQWIKIKKVAATDPETTTWGITSDDNYVLIKEENETYIEKPEWKESKKYDVATDYVLQEDIPACWDSDCKDSAEVTDQFFKGEYVQFENFYEDQFGRVSGQLPESGGYLLVKDEENELIKRPDVDPVDYVAQYIMKIREKPDLNAKQTGRIEEKQIVRILETKENSDHSIWGKLTSGDWVCIQDQTNTYFVKK